MRGDQKLQHLPIYILILFPSFVQTRSIRYPVRNPGRETYCYGASSRSMCFLPGVWLRDTVLPNFATSLVGSIPKHCKQTKPKKHAFFFFFWEQNRIMRLMVTMTNFLSRWRTKHLPVYFLQSHFSLPGIAYSKRDFYSFRPLLNKTIATRETLNRYIP